MYCSDGSELIPPSDGFLEFYRRAENLDEEELIQYLHKMIHFPLRYLDFKEGIVRQIPSAEKFEEFMTSIYGRQLIQHLNTPSVQERERALYEVSIRFQCDPLDNRYGISFMTFERRPEEQSLMDVFRDIFVPFVSSGQTRYLLGDEDLECT